MTNNALPRNQRLQFSMRAGSVTFNQVVDLLELPGLNTQAGVVRVAIDEYYQRHIRKLPDGQVIDRAQPVYEFEAFGRVLIQASKGPKRSPVHGDIIWVYGDTEETKKRCAHGGGLDLVKDEQLAVNSTEGRVGYRAMRKEQ